MTYTHKTKIIVLGDLAVGKTAILDRMIKKHYSYTHNSTIGIEFYIHNVTNSEYDLCLYFWDTSGDQKFLSITSRYYEGCVLGIVVFDISRRSTFQNVEFWVNEFRKNNQNKHILLVGNKIDLINRGEVSIEDINELTTKLNVPYILVSAKNTRNIIQLEEKIIEIITDGIKNGDLIADQNLSLFNSKFLKLKDSNIFTIDDNNENENSWFDCGKCNIM